MLGDCDVMGLVGYLDRVGQQQRRPVAERQPDTPVAGTQRPGTSPDHLTRRAQLVEHRRAVVAHAHAQQVGVKDRDGQGGALQRLDGIGHRIGAGSAAADVLPGGQETSQRVAVDRLDLAPQGRQAAAAQLAEHLGVNPLGACTPGRNSPEVTTPSEASASRVTRTTSSGKPNQAANSTAVKGPWVRA